MLHVWLGNLLRKLIPASHIALAIFGLLPFRQRRTCAWTPLSIRISYLPFNGPGELDQHYVLCAGETTSRLGNQELPRFHFFFASHVSLSALYITNTPPSRGYLTQTPRFLSLIYPLNGSIGNSTYLPYFVHLQFPAVYIWHDLTPQLTCVAPKVQVVEESGDLAGDTKRKHRE